MSRVLPLAYGIALRRPSIAEFKSCIRRLSRSLILSRLTSSFSFFDIVSRVLSKKVVANWPQGTGDYKGCIHTSAIKPQNIRQSRIFYGGQYHGI